MPTKTAAIKRLDATVETMGATEAAVMLAKLAFDADAKGKPTNRQNKAIADLWRVFEKRLQDARGKAGEAEAVNEYNRFIFLDGLLTATNDLDVIAYLQAVAFDAHLILTAIYSLMREDALTVMIGGIRRYVMEASPKPLTYHAYGRLTDWAKSDALHTIEGAVDTLTINDDDLTEAGAEELRDRLRAALEDAGDLVEGWSHEELFWIPVAIADDGTIPAWAALRAYWKPFVFRRGYRIAPESTFWEHCPAAIDLVVTQSGETLDEEAVVKLATDFYKECRRRTWGKTLTAKPDAGKLVALLYQSANPLTHFDPDADFGRVAWAPFAKDGDPAKMVDIDFVVEPAASTEAMIRAARSIGLAAEDNALTAFIVEDFYPTRTPEGKRLKLAIILRQMQNLESSRQPFSHDIFREDDELPLSAMFGLDFSTPVEQRAQEITQYDGIVLGVRRAFAIVADTYFDGRPILFSDGQTILEHIEDYLSRARDLLELWCDGLQRWPWNLNMSSLRPPKATEPDEEAVETVVNRIVKTAIERTGVNPAKVGLPTTPYYRKERGK